jgi:hypothetical protein
MTVSELITILQDYCKPNAEVCVQDLTQATDFPVIGVYDWGTTIAIEHTGQSVGAPRQVTNPPGYSK